MTDDELRSQIAERVCAEQPLGYHQPKDGCKGCGKDAVGECYAFEVADAILALIRPAIQAARVEALREAEKVARRDSEWHERACGDHASAGDKTGMMHAASRSNAADDIANAIADLIEKETVK